MWRHSVRPVRIVSWKKGKSTHQRLAGAWFRFLQIPRVAAHAQVAIGVGRQWTVRKREKRAEIRVVFTFVVYVRWEKHLSTTASSTSASYLWNPLQRTFTKLVGKTSERRSSFLRTLFGRRRMRLEIRKLYNRQVCCPLCVTFCNQGHFFFRGNAIITSEVFSTITESLLLSQPLHAEVAADSAWCSFFFFFAARL